jgi:xylulokinase
VLRSGMQLVDWIVRTTGAPPVAALEAKATEIAPGSDGLLVLPYWAGVMNPYWDEAARGAILGLSLDHGPAHLLRAVLEGISFEQAIATKAMEDAVGSEVALMTVAGGGTNSRLLLQILAAVLERPLLISAVNEASALGAAMLAAAAIGWYASVEEASKAMTAPAAARIEPDAALAAKYRPRKEVYRALYLATKDVHARLSELERPAINR